MTARKWRDLDSLTKRASTKTSGSTRIVRLFDPVFDLIMSIKPLRAKPDDYIFTDRTGVNPIDQWYFGQEHFQAALTVLKIRHRDFERTRHTFITAMLRHGENPKEVTVYVGNSPEVIFSNCAGLIGGHVGFGNAALEAAKPKSSPKPLEDPKEDFEEI